MKQVIQVEELVDGQRIDAFNFRLLLWSFLAMLADGYEITAMAFAAPDLVKEWGITKASLGPVFSASLIGVLFGAPLLGYVGDRLGRRTAIIAGSLLFAVSTLATVFAQTVEHLLILRLITGVGIGGLMPNAIALNSELSPKRWRATLVVLMFIGITVGNGCAGLVTAWLVPEYGWRVLFVIGGTVPFLVAIGLYFQLPESVKFLALHPHRRQELLQIARRMRSDLTIAEDAQFALSEVRASSTAGVRELFSGGMAWITPLLWVSFGMSLMAHYFLTSWMPLLFEANGASAGQAAWATTLYYAGGAIGSALMSLVLSRYGFVVIASLFALGVPAIATLGMFGESPASTALLAALSGFAVLGAQLGNNASAGLLYPTAYRSKGVGWALGIGRFGSIVGPLLGAWLIERQLSTEQIFLAAAAPMILGVLVVSGLAVLCYRRFRGLHLDDKAADTLADGEVRAGLRASTAN